MPLLISFVYWFGIDKNFGIMGRIYFMLGRKRNDYCVKF